MKPKRTRTILVVGMVLTVWSAGLSPAEPLGTVFTYQGRLIDANSAADGLYDFQFKLYDANTAGAQTGSTINSGEVDVIDGYFTVSLDFGRGIFDGNDRWLEIAVRAGELKDPNAYTVLSPRREVTPTPYAIYASGSNWNNLSGVPAGFADGIDNIGGGHSDWVIVIPDDNMYSDVSGNVGIGTTSPATKLDVVGDGEAVVRGFNVGTGNWGILGGSVAAVIGRHGSGKFRGGLADYECGAWGENLVTGSCGEIGGVNFGILGSGHGTDFAGIFLGDVSISGRLSKSSGEFKIDHPLDPENKYLCHSFVESPDMMDIYNGNIVLDENGQTWVNLPDYFDALNCDFRYQLTAIGAPAPNLHIAEKISNNRFKIAGGNPGMEVSWQVTGIRHDPYAVANRIVVETAKAPDEIGRYLHPEAYGLPKEKGIKTVRNPELHQSRQLAREAGAP